MSERTGTCATCKMRDEFSPRQDEVDRFGADVMGCSRLNYEGYTWPTATCEAYARDESRPRVNEQDVNQ